MGNGREGLVLDSFQSFIAGLPLRPMVSASDRAVVTISTLENPLRVPLYRPILTLLHSLARVGPPGRLGPVSPRSMHFGVGLCLPCFPFMYPARRAAAPSPPFPFQVAQYIYYVPDRSRQTEPTG
jgi:hypothetical protein